MRQASKATAQGFGAITPHLDLSIVNLYWNIRGNGAGSLRPKHRRPYVKMPAVVLDGRRRPRLDDQAERLLPHRAGLGRVDVEAAQLGQGP